MAFPICLGFAGASLVIALAPHAYFLYSPLSERRDHKKNTAVQLALAIFHIGEVGKLISLRTSWKLRGFYQRFGGWSSKNFSPHHWLINSEAVYEETYATMSQARETLTEIAYNYRG